MRVVNGKQLNELDAPALAAWHGRYAEVVVDLGTGDGRFVRQLAAQNQARGAIGVDLCAANLCAASRAAGENALFVIADALALPEAFHGLATRVTVHFPWGSLLRGLLHGDAGLLDGLRALGNEETVYEIALNAGALAEAGWTFASGSEHVLAHIQEAGFRATAMRELSPTELRGMPTSWAKRLAFGRGPKAISYRLSAISLGSAPNDGSTVVPPTSDSRLPTPDSRLIAESREPRPC